MNTNTFKINGEKNPIDFVLKYGVHIATRTTFFCNVALYQVDDIYVEMFYKKRSNEVERMRSFQSTDMLAPYLSQIDISRLF
jgi:hypothetical protein